MGRAPCCDKANVKKGPWSPEEDAKLKEYIEKHGTGGNWIALPQKAGLRRCGKSCRLRWLNYLRPNIKHGEFSDYEDRIICSLFASIGSRWSIIAAQLPGRTDNDIKNYWNTKLKKKLLQGMIMNSPSTHYLHQKKPQIISTNYPNSPSILQNPSISSTNYLDIPSAYNNEFGNNYLHAQSGVLLSHVGYNQIKECNNNKNLLVFGGEASCSTSSDGSCITNQINLGKEDFSNGVDENQALFLINSTNNEGFAVKEEKPDVLLNGSSFSENPMDYSLEEIKQLISTDNICNNLNFFVDHDQIKAEERVLYY